METMNQYFSYNKDYSQLPVIFGSLYRKMRIIHDNGMYVSSINSSSIIHDADFSFSSMALADNFELRKRENIVDLTKLFLGTYLSLSTGFRDFSSVDTEWFSNNINDINSVITSDDFYPEYFTSVLLEGENTYYDEFIEKKKQNDSLNSMNNKKGYKKVLNNSGSKLYQDQSEVFDEELPIERKSAYINFLFYPTLIICSMIVCFVVYTCLKYMVN